MKNLKFESIIQQVKGKDATYIEMPFDVEKEFGAKRVKVKARFDGVEYRGSIVNMGGCYMLGMTKAIRDAIGKQAGAKVIVELQKDEEERVVELPTDFEKALKKSVKAKKFYESLSYSNQRKYVLWITSAKKEETREKRVLEAIEKLNSEIKI